MAPPSTPRARVRRVFDARPLSTAPPRLKVRAFLESFDRGRGASALVLEGKLRGDELEITVLGSARVVLAGCAGEDVHGPFIWLNVEERAIGTDLALRIDADAHDADGCHAAITYFELTADRVARRDLEYAERWYSVFFNPLGLVDGVGSGGPHDVTPGERPS